MTTIIPHAQIQMSTGDDLIRVTLMPIQEPTHSHPHLTMLAGIQLYPEVQLRQQLVEEDPILEILMSFQEPTHGHP